MDHYKTRLRIYLTTFGVVLVTGVLGFSYAEKISVIEHGSFSDLLRAVFHLRDELMNRRSFAALPEADRRHLAGDVARIYRLLLGEWLSTMHYLKENYPFLFSLALRTNPFDPQASVVVKE